MRYAPGFIALGVDLHFSIQPSAINPGHLRSPLLNDCLAIGFSLANRIDVRDGYLSSDQQPQQDRHTFRNVTLP